MSAYYVEKILSVHHWNSNYFSFTCTRNESLRFDNGQFLLVGLQIPEASHPLVRAYSIASANWEEQLTFFSIKIADGALTSLLQHIKVGDEVLISKKPTGTLVLSDLLPGKYLYLLATGTGLAPFLSLTKDPEIYERFEKIILIHGVRKIEDLAYRDYFEKELAQHEYLGNMVTKQLIYYPMVSREPFIHEGRITKQIISEQLFKDIGLAPFDRERDRVMICGGPYMLKDLVNILKERGLIISPKRGVPGDFLIERAFVE